MIARVSFQGETGGRQRGVILAFVAVANKVVAVVEVDGELRQLDLDELKVLKGR
jgi:hypothetical protein